ncbi:hypothetical protein BJF86_10240 [Serinicoccus sp. CNJ-927]|nr:hypothetical protein BJF86_10240 [Serinicoccus sp. CNJ-927]
MGPMSEVKIHLEFFHDLIKGMETADTGIPTQVGRMQRVIQSVDLSSEGLYTPGRALDWVIDELPGLRRRLALAELINSMLPQGMDVVTIDESQLPTQSPHEAEADARRAAELMTIYGSPMYEDTINEEGELPQEIVDLLKENAHDPYFAAELAEQTDPAVVASFLENLAKANNRFLQMEEDPPDSYAADYDTIVQGLGTSLGQATSNTGDLALDDDVRERWLTAMTTPTFAAEPGELATPGDDAAILTFLTTTGNWDPQFLQSAVERVYVQERHHEGGHEMWWTGTGPPMLPGFEDGPMDPMTQLLLGVRNHPGTVQALLDDDRPQTRSVDGEEIGLDGLTRHLVRRGWPMDEGQTVVGTFAVATNLGDPAAGKEIAGVLGRELEDLQADIAADNKEAERLDRHVAADWASVVPVIGTPVDVGNALWYASEGDWGNAGWSVLGIAPVVGDGLTGLRNLARNADNVSIRGIRLTDLVNPQQLDDFLAAHGRLPTAGDFFRGRFLISAERIAKLPPGLRHLGRIFNGQAHDAALTAATREQGGFGHVYLNAPAGYGGRGKYVVADGWIPPRVNRAGEQVHPGAILEFKGSQLRDIKESTWSRYVDQIADQYPSGARIADVPTSTGALDKGFTKIDGDLYIVVPRQSKRIPEEMIEYAEERGVRILQDYELPDQPWWNP